MKIPYLIFAVLMTVAGSATAGQRLLPWVGKHPSTKINGQTPASLLTHDPVLRKMLPRSEMTLINSFWVGGEVERDGDYLLIAQCKAHDCSANHSLVIENAKGDLWIGIYESREGFISTRWYTLPMPPKKGDTAPLDHWYGMDDHTALPESIQKKFLRGHVAQ